MTDKKTKNDNCLAGMKCPNCGSLQPFYINAKACFKVCDEGTLDFTDVEWNASTFCVCVSCNHDGCVSDFTEEKHETAI